MLRCANRLSVTLWCYTFRILVERCIVMTWETPQFVEVKMDAEINSYQDDFGEDRDTGV